MTPTLIADLRGLHQASEVACAVAQAEQDGNHALAYRQFLQFAADLRQVSPLAARELVRNPPRTRTRWDDAFAALAEEFLGAEAPSWTLSDGRAREPREPWEPRRDSAPLWFPVDLNEVSPAFARRGIYIELNELF